MTFFETQYSSGSVWKQDNAEYLVYVDFQAAGTEASYADDSAVDDSVSYTDLRLHQAPKNLGESQRHATLLCQYKHANNTK